MTQAERDRLCVIRQAAEGRISRREAAGRLEVTTRQVRRLVVDYRERGDAVAIHGLRGKSGNRGWERRDEGVADLVVQLYRERYADYSVQLFTERLSEAHWLSIAGETARRWLAHAGVRVPRPAKRERHPRRARRPRFGELLQVDTSIHAWFEKRASDGREPVLICAIDDATSRVYGRFFEGDTVLANMELIRRWIERHGRPGAIYVDCAGHFAGKLDEDGGDNRDGTQIGRMLRELDIELVLAGSPQAKGRVERTFGTHQDRLVKRLRERGIRTIEAANEYLETEYWAAHNASYGAAPASDEDAHRALTIEQRRRFSEICAERHSRTLNAGEVVKFENRFLLVKANGRHGPRRGVKIEVVIQAPGVLRLRYQGRDLPFEDVTERLGALTAERRRRAERAEQRARLTAELERKGVKPHGALAERPIEALTPMELQALRPPARPALDHPWRRKGLTWR